MTFPGVRSMHDPAIPCSREPIRVFVAEANCMASQLIKTVLQRERQKFAVRACCGGSAEIFHELEKHDPHVAIISAELQDGPLTGFQILHRLRNSKPNTGAVMLLNSDDRDLVIDAFRCGARAIFTRTHSVDALPRCICAVRQGQPWLESDQVDLLLDLIMHLRPLQIPKSGNMALLTQRERDVVSLVAEGMRNADISRKLNIGEHTIRNYLSHIFDKLGVSSRVELVLYAFSRYDSSPGQTGGECGSNSR